MGSDEVTKNGVELQIMKHCNEKSDKIFKKVEEVGKTVHRELQAQSRAITEFGAQISSLADTVADHEDRITDLQNNPGEEAQEELDRLQKFKDKVKIALVTLAISIPLTLTVGAVTYFLISAMGG